MPRSDDWCAVDARDRYFWEGSRLLSESEAVAQATACAQDARFWDPVVAPQQPYRVMRYAERVREMSERLQHPNPQES